MSFVVVAPGCGKAFKNGCRDTLTCSQGADAGDGGEHANGGSPILSGGARNSGGGFAGAIDPGLGGDIGLGGTAGEQSGGGADVGGTGMGGSACIVGAAGEAGAPAISPCDPGLTSLTAVSVHPSDPNLLEAMIPGFDRSVPSYAVEASFWVTELRFEAAAERDSIVTVNGVPTISGSSQALPLAVGGNLFQIVVRAGGRATTYSVSVHRREPIRFAPTAPGIVRFGHAVAVHGDRLVVGAPTKESSPGSVFTFRRTGPGAWIQETLVLTGPETFGTTVAFDGTTMATGAPAAELATRKLGAVYLYGGSPWVAHPGTPLGQPESGFQFADQVALSGTSLVVGSREYNKVNTYSRTSNNAWTEDPGSPLSATDGLAFIDAVFAIEGDWLVIGAHNAAAGPTTFLYQRKGPGQAWTPPSTGDVVLTSTGMFADSVAISGSTVVVNGDPVRVFERTSSNTWSDSMLSYHSKGPVALAGDLLVVGAQQDEFNGVTGNQVQVFRRVAGATSTWREDQASPLPSLVGPHEEFGFAVSTSDGRVVVGAPAELPNGAIYIYD